MYLVRGNEIVADNDDYTGLASEIIYTPTATDTYRLVIRAYTTSTPGVCDLFQGVDGAPPTQLEGNITFAGDLRPSALETGRMVRNRPACGRQLRRVQCQHGGPSEASVVTGPIHNLFLIYPNSAVGSKMYLGR